MSLLSYLSRRFTWSVVPVLHVAAPGATVVYQLLKYCRSSLWNVFKILKLSFLCVLFDHIGKLLIMDETSAAAWNCTALNFTAINFIERYAPHNREIIYNKSSLLGFTLFGFSWSSVSYCCIKKYVLSKMFCASEPYKACKADALKNLNLSALWCLRK